MGFRSLKLVTPKPVDLGLAAIVLGLLALAAHEFTRGDEADEDWRAFAEANECKEVARLSGAAIGPDGQPATQMTHGTSRDRVAFKCKDGSIHWR